MSNSPYIIDVTQENFANVVLEGSQQVPVLVDFWAEWCEPCKALMPILSQLAQEYQGQFVLAKVNTDTQQELAVSQGIRSLPTVRLYQNGQAVDEFMGALPEPQVRQFLDQYVAAGAGSGSDSDQLQAIYQLFATGEFEQAGQLLQGLLADDPDNTQLKLAQARLYMAQGDTDAALQVLDKLPSDDAHSEEIVQFRGSLAFAVILQDAPEADVLQQRLQQDPQDDEARYYMAAYLVLQENYEMAMQQLLALIQQNKQFKEGAAQKSLIALFDMLGGDSPLVKQCRRKMFTLLH